MLLNSKSALREQIAGEIIAKPAERRAKLVQMNNVIDDLMALLNEHYTHCHCESTSSVTQKNLSSAAEVQPKRQSRKSLAGFSRLVRG